MIETNQQIRRENIILILDESGDSQKLMSEKLGKKDATQVSQMLSEKVQRKISDAFARHIELVYGKTIGWMDVPHENPHAANENDSPINDPNLAGLVGEAFWVIKTFRKAVYECSKIPSKEAQEEAFRLAIELGCLKGRITEEQIRAILDSAITRNP